MTPEEIKAEPWLAAYTKRGEALEDLAPGLLRARYETDQSHERRRLADSGEQVLVREAQGHVVVETTRAVTFGANGRREVVSDVDEDGDQS